MATGELAQKECKPCKGDVPPLKGADLKDMQNKLDAGWDVVDEHHLEKTYTFDDYEQSVFFTNAVAKIAQEQDHHPDILLTYGKVKVTVWTHSIDGLTESDFVFAAKTEEAHQNG
jgi:4a-hydroxytetrahydrobiopterin dehydratase